jgi:hypothetical protein
MAFTNPWSNIIPAGSDPANTADDEIRQLRLDIDERMDTIVGDWSADPIVNLTTIRKTAHWSDGNFDPLGVSTLTEGYEVFGVQLHPVTQGQTAVWRMNMGLPVGATLQKVDFRVFRGNVFTVMNIQVAEADDTIPSEFVLSTAVVGTATGWVTPSLGPALGFVVAQDKPLLAKVDMLFGVGSSAVDIGLFQVHYEYDIPNALTGIVG